MTSQATPTSTAAPLLGPPEIRLMPGEWRAVIYGLSSFLVDLQQASAELEEADTVALPTLATAFTAFQVTIRTTLSLRNAIDASLERKQSAQRYNRGQGADAGRVAVRHMALSTLPSILDEAANRLQETGHAHEADAMRAISRKVHASLPLI